MFNNFQSYRIIRWGKSLITSWIFRALITTMVVFFCGAYLIKNLKELTIVRDSLRFDWLLLCMSFLIVVLIVCTGGLAWILILKALGQKIYIIEGLKIQNYANISKYIPGFLWPYASKVYLSKKVGIIEKISGLSILLEFFLLIFVGFFVSLFFFPKDILSNYPYLKENSLSLQVLGIGLLLLILIIIIFQFGLIQRKLKLSFFFKKELLLISSLLLCLNWLGLGIGLWLISKSIYTLTSNNIGYFVFSFAVSMIAGILILPVPNGVGVRESIMVFLLSTQLPSSIAVILAVLSRLLIIIGEVVNLAGIALIQKITKSKMND